jgi:rRNA maturation RNase YbeY
MAVTFHIEEIVGFKFTNRRILGTWLRLVAKTEGKRVGGIACIFCDDEYLLSLNKTYLEHDYYTDVITFEYSVGDMLSGDIFISIDSVQANAEKYKVSFWNELYRVMVHGVLHLCGYRDATAAEQAVMRAKENAYLDELYFEQPPLANQKAHYSKKVARINL